MEADYDLPEFNEGNWDCPKCGCQAFLIADDWSEPNVCQYFFECDSPDCDYVSQTFPEKYHDEVIVPMEKPFWKGIIHGQMKPL